MYLQHNDVFERGATRLDAIAMHSHGRPPRDGRCCEDGVETAQLLLTTAKTRSYRNKQDTARSEATVIGSQRLAAAPPPPGGAAARRDESSGRDVTHDGSNVIGDT